MLVANVTGFLWVNLGVSYKDCFEKDELCETTCHNEEIGLRAQNMITILGSIVNISGGDVCEHLMSMRIFNLRYSYEL